MKLKKNNNVNLEKKRTLFLEVGFVIVLTLVLVAFEWNFGDKATVIETDATSLNLDQDIIPITRPKEPEKPKPLPVQKPVEQFEVVDNVVDIVDEPLFQTTESGEDLGVAIGNYNMGEDNVADEPEVFVRVEEMPTFKGKHSDSFLHWIMKRLEYPQVAVENGISGTVWVKFVIDENGKMTRVEVMRSVHPSLDEEAIRVVRSSPDWNPGKQRDKAVKVSFNFPITFRLQ
jgi:protein TonB